MNFEVQENKVEIDLILRKIDLEIKSEDRGDVEIDFSGLTKSGAEERFIIEFSDNKLKIHEKKHVEWGKYFDVKDRNSGKLLLLFPVDIETSGTITTYNGDIEAETWVFNGNIKSYSGNIKVSKSLKGDITSKIYSGDMEVENFEGKLQAKSYSGDIKINSGLIKQLNLKSFSGDVDIKGIFQLDKTSTIKSMSGDVRLDINEYRGEEKLNIRVLSGDIDVKGDYPEDKIEIKRTTDLSGKFEIRKLKKLIDIFGGNKAEVKVEESTNNINRILEMLDSGKINSDQAEKLIKSLKV